MSGDEVCPCGHVSSQHTTLEQGACRECMCPYFMCDPFADCTINRRWTIRLPAHRAYRPEWPVWEQERLASMSEHLEGGERQVVWDVGAEEGDLSWLVQSWGNDVVPIEAGPRVWRNIRAIWRENGHPEPPIARWVGFMGETSTLIPERLNVDLRVEFDGWPKCAHGDVVVDHGFRHLDEETDATPTIRGDDLVSATGVTPDALTIDVEGAELAVLRGCSTLLLEERPLVWCSVHPDILVARYGATAENVLHFMRECGYDAEHLATDHEEHWLFTPQ